MTDLTEGLLAAMETQANRTSQRGCVVGRVVADLRKRDPEAATVIVGWLEASKDEIGHAKLTTTLGMAGVVNPATGHPLSAERIGTHRTGRCSCVAAGLT